MPVVMAALPFYDYNPFFKVKLHSTALKENTKMSNALPSAYIWNFFF